MLDPRTFVGLVQQPLFLPSPLTSLESLYRLNGGLDANAMSQREGVGKVWIDRMRNIGNEEGRSDFTKNKRGSGRWSALLNGPCGLLLLVLLVLSSTCSSKGSSSTSTTSSPTSSMRALVALSLFLLLGLLLLLLEQRRRTRTLDGAYLSSGLRLLGMSGTVGELLFPAVVDHLFDLIAV